MSGNSATENRNNLSLRIHIFTNKFKKTKYYGKN